MHVMTFMIEENREARPDTLYENIKFGPDVDTSIVVDGYPFKYLRIEDVAIQFLVRVFSIKVAQKVHREDSGKSFTDTRFQVLRKISLLHSDTTTTLVYAGSDLEPVYAMLLIPCEHILELGKFASHPIRKQVTLSASVIQNLNYEASIND